MTKSHREWIHRGRYVEVDTAAPGVWEVSVNGELAGVVLGSQPYERYDGVDYHANTPWLVHDDGSATRGPSYSTCAGAAFRIAMTRPRSARLRGVRGLPEAAPSPNTMKRLGAEK